MHHFNITEKPLLREGWINLWRETDARTRMSWYMGMEPTQVIGLSVSPNQNADYHYSWTVASDLRLIRVFGHRHFWTTNFSTWIERADGKVRIAYQSDDGFDMPTYRYDSVVKNPDLDPSKQLDGALSGIVQLKAGDKLHFNCTSNSLTRAKRPKTRRRRRARSARSASPTRRTTARCASSSGTSPAAASACRRSTRVPCRTSPS